jgi:hypothetical protein
VNHSAAHLDRALGLRNRSMYPSRVAPSSSIVSAEKSAGRLRDTTRHPIGWSLRTIGTAKTDQGRPLALQYVTKAYFR